MPVYADSRYANVEYTTILGKDGVSRKYLHPRDTLTEQDVSADWVVHEVKQGDDLDLVAYQYTGDNPRKAKYWWIVADVNDVLWPLDIEPGSDLIVPTGLLATRGVK